MENGSRELHIWEPPKFGETLSPSCDGCGEKIDVWLNMTCGPVLGMWEDDEDQCEDYNYTYDYAGDVRSPELAEEFPAFGESCLPR